MSESPAAFVSAEHFVGVGGASTFTYFTCSISRPIRARSAGGIITCVMSGASCTMIGIFTAFEIASK